MPQGTPSLSTSDLRCTRTFLTWGPDMRFVPEGCQPAVSTSEMLVAGQPSMSVSVRR